MNIEQFKLTLMNQFKDDSSAFHCLLSTRSYSERIINSRPNVSIEPLMFYASDYGIKVLFEWQKQEGEFVYTMQFMDEPHHEEIDLCDGKMVIGKTYAEEVIVYREDKMIMGLCFFKLEQEGYSFRRVHDNRLHHTLTYDVKSGEFVDSKSNVHLSWLVERNNRMLSSNRVYLDLTFNKKEQKRFDDFCNTNNVSGEVRQRVFSALIGAKRPNSVSPFYHAYLNLK